MSVPTYRRKEGKLTAEVKARELLERIVKAVSNDRKFDPIYYDVFTSGFVKKVRDGYLNVWRANNIQVNSREDYLERKKLQEQAILDIEDFLGLLSSSAKIYKISKRRAFFWADKAMEVLSLIRAWKETDYERYGRIYSKDAG